jgi:hypothetical protein
VPLSTGAALKSRCDAWTVARVVTALVSFMPFVYGLAAGGVFFFRDLSAYFFPIRRFIVEGLLRGEIRHFNPYVNEGVRLALPPLAYPLDLLQAIVPNEWGFSLLLALHVPLAALTFLALGRGLGLGPIAATIAAIVYALCGFSLSCLNLYIHLEALAWAPLMILLLMRASSGRAREVALAGAATALCLSTTGVEITAQAALCAFVLMASRRVRDHLRFAASLAFGGALAAAPLISLFSLVSGSRREAGFSVAESLALSVHPVSLLQTLIGGLYGDPVVGGYEYWGTRFWGEQAPYFLSLYLGGAALCFAALGATWPDRRRIRLLILLAAALLICLGRFVRLDLLLGLVPFLVKLRFPVKAFFTVVVAVALLVGAGADRLLASRRAWRLLLALSAFVGLGLLSLSLVGPWLPGISAWLQGHFFADAYPRALRAAALRSVAADARAGAAAVLAMTGLAVAKIRLRISAQAAVLAAAALIAADLLRAGVGLNPTTRTSFYALSPEMHQVVERLRQSGGRVFTCTILAMPTYRAAVRRTHLPNLWTAGVWRETLSPLTNTDVGIPTTGADPTALVPAARSLATDDVMCRDAGTPRRLREAGVRFVLSVQPFLNSALHLVDVAAPARAAPLKVYVYTLAGSLPDPAIWPVPDDLDQQGRGQTLEGARVRYLDDRPGFVRLAVETPRDAYLILRRSDAAGWSATVNGRPTAVVAANGRHQAVAVPPGNSVVSLIYRDPNAWLGSVISMMSAVAVAILWLRGSRGRT